MNKKVWLSNAAGLNDPFECTIQEIAEDYINEKVKEMKDAQISGFVMSCGMAVKGIMPLWGMSTKLVKQTLKKLKKESNYEKKYKLVRETFRKHSGGSMTRPRKTFENFDKQLQQAGIFSLSEDPINELMWAHYGGNSTGIAIGFNVSENSNLSDPEKCIKVTYSDELPSFESEGFLVETSLKYGGKNEQRIAFNDPTLLTAISTKSKAWNYEKEWRYVEPDQGEYQYPGPINQIVFGLNTKEETIKKYKDLANSLGTDSMAFFKVRKEPNTNKLRLEKLKGSD